MEFEERLELIKVSLTKLCKDKIIKRYNFNSDFSLWSYSEIMTGYIDEFTEQYGEWIRPKTSELLWFAGKNLSFAVHTYVTLNKNYTLDSLLEFVDTFLSIQLGDAENWASDIMMEMP